MKIITKEREFIDDEKLDLNGMIDYFSKYKGTSKTSCPNPQDWLDAFGDAQRVVCVTITSALSGSYNSACVAKNIYESEHPDRRVFVLDTLSAGPEISLIVRKLTELAASGADFDSVCERIVEYSRSTGLIFMLKSLKNFANNGRISPIVAKIVGIAGICIAGRASTEGKLDPAHKCRGEARALETLLSDLGELGFTGGRVSIGHCNNESAAQKLRAMIENKYEGVEIEIHHMRGLCCFYAEMGGLLVGFEKGAR